MHKQKTLDVGKSVTLVQADGQHSTRYSLYDKHGIIRMVLCNCLHKRGEFHHFTIRVGVKPWFHVKIKIILKNFRVARNHV